MNRTRKDIFLNLLRASFGLCFCAFGTYMTLQANIGVAPYDVLHVGLSRSFGFSYGTASILVSLMVLVIDLLMREKIGLGMLLDSFLVGKVIDLFYWLNVIPPLENSYPVSVVMMLAGLFLQGIGQSIYMRSALGCGPRDTLFVGLAKRARNVPIAIINNVVLITVTVVGYLLGGPPGIGTIICALCSGPLIQFAFHLSHFDPRTVEHQDILTSMKILIHGSAEA